MKRLSKILESVWSEMEDRGTGDVLKKEDGVVVQELTIDGVHYKFTDRFMGMGDTYEEEEEKEWTGFAFNKMPNGSNVITGDTDAAGVFGSNYIDFGDVNDYDVYVLRDYIDNKKENLIQLSLDAVYEDCPEHYYVEGLHETIEKYVRDIYENHMSDYAQYKLVCTTDNEDWMNAHFVMKLYQDTDMGELEVVKEEFDKPLLTTHNYLFPNIDGWTGNLIAELDQIYANEGWTKSKTFTVDDSIVPKLSTGVCYVLFDDEEEPEEVSESIWDDMQDRGTGDTVKKEDEFNPEYIDFGENTTVYWAKESLVLDGEEKFNWHDIKDYNNNGWRLPTLEEVKQVNWPKVNISWYEHGWHIRFEDGNEIKVITDGSEPSMWTSSYEQRINTVAAYYYGYGGSRFNINSCIPYSKDFVILVKDKK